MFSNITIKQKLFINMLIAQIVFGFIGIAKFFGNTLSIIATIIIFAGFIELSNYIVMKQNKIKNINPS